MRQTWTALHHDGPTHLGLWQVLEVVPNNLGELNAVEHFTHEVRALTRRSAPLR